MGREKAVSFWQNGGGYDMILVAADWRVFVTEGLWGVFETDMPVEVLSRR